MSIECPLRVEVKEMTLNNDRGTRHMLDESQTVSVCIDPNQLTFTDGMYQRWAGATEHPNYNATPSYTYQTYLAANEHLRCNLYIELKGGYITTISHTELVSNERGPRIDDLGEYAPLNNSRIMASIGRGSTDYGQDFGMLLGGVFLASTYVFVDYENNQFGLAPAILGSTQANIQRQCSKDTSIPPQIGTEKNSTSPGGSNTTSKALSSGLSASDKIAMGVSIPAGVAALATLLLMILINRRKQKAQKQKDLREQEQFELEKQRHGSISQISRILSERASASPEIARSPSIIADQHWGKRPSLMTSAGTEEMRGSTATERLA